MEGTEHMRDDFLTDIYDELQGDSFFGNLHSVLETCINILISLIFLITLYYVICGFLYYRWTGRHFVVDRFFLPDYPDNARALLIMARKRNKESNKYKMTLPTKQGIESGIFLGKTDKNIMLYSSELDEGNVAVIGFPGSGKTVNLIQTLRHWRGGVFYIDISGDITKARTRKHQIIYDPVNGIGQYDVFFAVRKTKDREKVKDEIGKIVKLLLPEAAKEDSGKYFETGGRHMLQAAMLFYYYQGYEFGDFCWKFVSMGVMELLDSITQENEDELYEDILALIGRYDGQNEKNLAGCKGCADDAISLFAEKGKLRKTLVSFKGLGIVPDTLEICDMAIVIPQELIPIYKPIVRLLMGQIIDYATQRPLSVKRPILLALDEFARFGDIDGIVDALGTLRKRKVRMMILTQNKSDLDLVYGKETASSILGNCSFKMCFGANDTETQEYFAKLVGEHFISRNGVTTSAMDDRWAHNEQKHYIIEPQELAYMAKQKNKFLLLSPTGYAVMNQHFWFKSSKKGGQRKSDGKDQPKRNTSSSRHHQRNNR